MHINIRTQLAWTVPFIRPESQRQRGGTPLALPLPGLALRLPLLRLLRLPGVVAAVAARVPLCALLQLQLCAVHPGRKKRGLDDINILNLK